MFCIYEWGEKVPSSFANREESDQSAYLHTKVQGATVVTLTSALASVLASHFKVLCQIFYVMGKALTGKLSCMRTGLVFA